MLATPPQNCNACSHPPTHTRPQVVFAAELQRRADATGGGRPWLRSVALHPGEVLTDVVRSLPGPLQAAYRALLQAVLLTPAQGARCSVYCATSADLEGSKEAGTACYFDSNCAPIKPSRSACDACVYVSVMRV